MTDVLNMKALQYFNTRPTVLNKLEFAVIVFTFVKNKKKLSTYSFIWLVYYYLPSATVCEFRTIDETRTNNTFTNRFVYARNPIQSFVRKLDFERFVKSEWTVRTVLEGPECGNSMEKRANQTKKCEIPINLNNRRTRKRTGCGRNLQTAERFVMYRVKKRSVLKKKKRQKIHFPANFFFRL